MADSKKKKTSSKKSVRSRDSEATQTEILDAAVEEFALQGLNNARIETIAANTGVTKAMIYYYFVRRSKSLDLSENFMTEVMDF
ncbi:TetR/AcrR family transcriptional regulator [Myxosarcina sp. GI1]|uniref:TetR/AcrR family transcriptional regulator n=1 Tax=Myxosarcina sp. GI1 TaxID=1541065 RepID=UPI00056064A7|nr:helix-turn-helix domain-containing protein [Myxosarcina sp. GI1]